ncbi:multiheme c-type cytochrome [Paludisphaera borealis]|uniref:Hydroxylamine oxidoreductase n=1 Tax=Paludisphaera borealis TaxID=1387353 RepID=A0A1U7CY59_9BACT|nr:multiheme c-type cytochrome [Paludisphaera borealis]APW63890.1 Hydroxylamine oxidoreductase [Paludisphaera borealis]
MSFRGLFIAVLISTAMIVSAFMIQSKRPHVEVKRPTADLVKANGKCAECHLHETSAVIHEYEMSRHNEKGVNCLDCHQPTKGQEPLDHKGFTITKKLSSANCQGCHPQQYDEYLKSRHAAPAWASVAGPGDFTAEQIAFSEAIHKGAVDRPAHDLTKIEGVAAVNKGCRACHDVGKPNADGSIGSCTACHARHVASVELARLPETCGQCHMGPDHSQLEIYHESKHGVLFNAQRATMNLKARPEKLSTSDMPVPTCATCHMSGLEGEKFTHDVTQRLSYFLFATVSDRRPKYEEGKKNMQAICLKCHTSPRILQFYSEAEGVVKSTNTLVKEAKTIVDGLHKDGLLTPEPFDEPIEYLYFDLWHYGGRTAKHGAYMGGADFVQWHGYYEIVSKLTELKKGAEELRAKAAAKADAPKAAEEPRKPGGQGDAASAE